MLPSLVLFVLPFPFLTFQTTTVDPTREKLRAMVQQNEALTLELEAIRLHAEGDAKAREHQLRESFELLDHVRKSNEALQAENKQLGGSQAEDQSLTHETGTAMLLFVQV
jgi:hypothetical protein